MKIQNIYLKNIGSHKETNLDFTDMPNIMAVTGHNGAGKTFLMEAVPATLYGIFPTRPGSIYDKITKGYEGKANLAIQFEMNGKYYCAERILTKKGKTSLCEARLYCGSTDDESLIAGPKVKDFENAIVNLLGPESLFLSSVFSSQNRAGDLCDAKPTERKDIYGRMLGLEKIDNFSKDAKKRADFILANLSGDLEKLTDFKEKAKGLPEALKTQKDNEASIDKMKNLVESNNTILIDVEKKIKSSELSQEKKKGLTDRAEIISREISRVTLDLNSDRSKYKELLTLAESVKEIEGKMNSIKDLRKKLEDIQNLLSMAEKSANDIKIQKTEFLSISSQINSLDSQALLLKKIPAENCCTKCPLVSGAYEARNKSEKLNKELVILKDAIPEGGAEIDTKIKDFKKQMSEYTDQINLLSAGNIEAKYASAQSASDSVKLLETSGKSKAKTLSDKKAELDKINSEIAGLNVEDTTTISKEAEIVRSAIREGNREMNELSANSGVIKEKIAGIKLAIAEVEKLEPEYNKKKIDADDYAMIAQAFGKTGIQPIIIDEARPEMEEIADELLRKATDGRMRVRFETQKMLKSGDLSESLDIIISENGSDRDISEFSGGEQKLLRTVIRLTVASWQSRKGGNKLKTLFVDEAFENLDGENAEKILAVFDGLRDSFDKIILISHDDSMIQELPARINLTKKAGKVEIKKIK